MADMNAGTPPPIKLTVTGYNPQEQTATVQSKSQEHGDGKVVTPTEVQLSKENIMMITDQISTREGAQMSQNIEIGINDVINSKLEFNYNYDVPDSTTSADRITIDVPESSSSASGTIIGGFALVGTVIGTAVTGPVGGLVGAVVGCVVGVLAAGVTAVKNHF